MFEDLELPDMERKILREVMSERIAKRKGYRRVGVRVHLDRRRTAKSRLRRKVATGGPSELPPLASKRPDAALQDDAEPERFPFRREDLIYKRLIEDTRGESNAVVICIMDTSGSMDSMKKYLARSFFFLLYQFVSTKYQNVDLVFIGHHTQAREVTEEEFFHKGESGGTLISSGYNKALEIIYDRYHPSLWNVYDSIARMATTSIPTMPMRSRRARSCARCATCSATARSSRSARITTRARCSTCFAASRPTTSNRC